MTLSDDSFLLAVRVIALIMAPDSLKHLVYLIAGFQLYSEHPNMLQT